MVLRVFGLATLSCSWNGEEKYKKNHETMKQVIVLDEILSDENAFLIRK